jgi:hypothetical protein
MAAIIFADWRLKARWTNGLRSVLDSLSVSRFLTFTWGGKSHETNSILTCVAPRRPSPFCFHAKHCERTG